MDDYYKSLGVKKSARPEEIKAAYRALAKKWHPDLNPKDEHAADVFKQINVAYHVLSKPELRADYDHRLNNYLRAKVKSRSRTDLKTRKADLDAHDELERLKEFMNKMRASFENLIYEEIESGHSPGWSSPLQKKIKSLKKKWRGPINKIIDLIYEEKK